MLKASLLNRISPNLLSKLNKNQLPKSVKNAWDNQLRENSSTTRSTDFIKKSRPGVEGYDLPPLTQKLNDSVAPTMLKSVSSRNFDTHVTKLDNGLRVASEKLFGEFCTVGVIIDAGPRYESPFVSGTTHFIEKLAFNSSLAYDNRDTVLQTLEKYGAICDCQSGRDAIVYALSCRRSGLPQILHLLADTLYRPLYQDFEIEQVRRSLEFELEDLHTRPDPEPLLAEMLHYAAYQKGPLANPKICPSENIEKITREDLYFFQQALYKPERTVLTCIGTDHQEFVEMTKENFCSQAPIWNSDKSVLGSNQDKTVEIDQRKSTWKGGSCIIEKDLSDLNQGTNNQMPELTHLVVGLESPSYLNEHDFVTSCVINTLMGGGGSFSAGGPGKGMYSRLYLNVLNRYHFMFSATAYNQSYMDSGVFYIHASAPPQYLDDMCTVIGQEILKMALPCNQEELSRAKTQLQSMLFMNLEQRPVLFEDVARQVLSRGKREQAQYYFDRIEAVTAKDVQRVARKMLETAPAVSSLGRLGNVEPYERIKKLLGSASTSGTRSRKFFG